jgi:APA family basic amino acid/polyamine antiporter
MSAPKRKASGSLFGRTLETVLAERPCRVIIETGPNGGEPKRVAAARPVAA